MDAIRELFTTDIGLLSVVTIVIATYFVIFVYNYAKKQMEIDAKNAEKK
jgi:hypothetical protein